MSKDELIRFRQDLRSNPEMKKDLKIAKKSATRLAIRDFAAAAGYSIEMDDFRQFGGDDDDATSDS
jgi:GrpB-like predicted nucleotidyltransferase (UPF0157 family)